jgi:pyruvate formate lyase activating enzyme
VSETNIFDKNKYGYVFNIQCYSLHDGPGIRTLVFLKGCPLRCKWCSNPESQLSHPELAYNTNKCIGTEECSICLKVCHSGAVEVDSSNNKIKINRELCDNCLECAEICPSKALITFGKLMSIEDVLNAVEKDSVFYSRSGGGLTIGGGEPLMQPEFAAGLVKEAKRRKINTSLETCGYAEWGAIEKVCAHLDTIFFDIKCIDSAKHKEFTGIGNKKILENFGKLCKRFPNTPIIVRTTIIPGFNDSEEDIIAIANFIDDIPNMQYELLAYHHLGESKYGFIGREYPLSPDLTVDKERIASLKKIVKSKLNIKVL